MVVGRQSPVVGRNAHAAADATESRSPRGYRDLDVYKRSFGLLKPLHRLVLTFPDYEKYDLASQLRRSAKSIPANIGEGYALRDAPKLFCKHLRIAYGSATEVRVHLDIALDLEYISTQTHADLEPQFEVVTKQLYRLWQHWRRTLGVTGDDDS